jgi:hypothetical protein
MSDGIRSGVEPERGAERFDELRLRQTRHADQERMAAGQDRHQRIFDDALLAEDDRADRVARGADARRHLFGRADDHVFQFLDTFSGHSDLLLPYRQEFVCSRPCLSIAYAASSIPGWRRSVAVSYVD